jgi:RNA polymerase subunit RPABC4/transcription elongation factor Spt4
VQTCSRCYTQSSDDTAACPNCHADLQEWSESTVALKKLQANHRVRAIRILVQDDCCPTCQKAMATYPKDAVPRLPVEGCSHENGCRCFYAPILDEIYP